MPMVMANKRARPHRITPARSGTDMVMVMDMVIYRPYDEQVAGYYRTVMRAKPREQPLVTILQLPV